MSDNHQRVEAAIKAFANGEIVVVTDDDDRENEGDLFVAASHCTPDKMAFIIRNTSGIVCAPLGADQARRRWPAWKASSVKVPSSWWHLLQRASSTIARRSV